MIIGVSAGVTVLVAVWLFLQPEEYECEVEFVPPDLSMASPLLREAALVPGTASDLERVYSYLHSFWLRQALIDTFHLYERYHLQNLPSPSKRATALNRILNRQFTIRITRNSTLYISVRDTSPEFAYEVASFLIRRVEGFCKGVIRMEEALRETEDQLRKLIHEIRTLEESLSDLRVKYRILTAGENRFSSPSLGSPEALKYYDQVLSQETRLIRLQEAYARLLEEKYRREDFIRVYPQAIFVIQPPYKPSFPASTPRFFILTLVGIGSLALSTFLVLYAYRVGLLREQTVQPKEPAFSPSA